MGKTHVILLSLIRSGHGLENVKILQKEACKGMKKNTLMKNTPMPEHPFFYE